MKNHNIANNYCKIAKIISKGFFAHEDIYKTKKVNGEIIVILWDLSMDRNNLTSYTEINGVKIFSMSDFLDKKAKM